MNFKTFIETLDGRKRGKSLPEAGYTDRDVRIYRAIDANQFTFNAMDYIGIGTYGLRFCKEHAEHQAAVHEEPYHVITARVPAAHVFEAYNPGEYFYDGPPVRGNRSFGSLVSGDSS